MIAVVCILILAALFFIISGFLYGGKGSWLIAGFGTSSREERAKYDEKKVCRAMGVFCTICGVMLCLLAYLSSQVEQGQMAEKQLLPFGIVFLVVLLASLAGVACYIRKTGRK